MLDFAIVGVVAEDFIVEAVEPDSTKGWGGFGQEQTVDLAVGSLGIYTLMVKSLAGFKNGYRLSFESLLGQ